MKRRTARVCAAVVMAMSGIALIGGDSGLLTETACLLENEAGTANTHADNLIGHANEHYAFISDISLRHWDKATVTVYASTTDGKRNPDEVHRLLDKAAQLWNQQVSPVVQVTVTDRPDADIELHFVPGRSLPPRTVGQTSILYRSFSGTLCHARIALEEGLPEEKCIQALAHEMGHALGIQGHSPNHEDLMFDRAHLPALVTPRDANTLRIGYGINGATVRTPDAPANAGTSVPPSIPNEAPPVPEAH